MIRFITFICALIFSLPLFAKKNDIVFEGYYKLLASSKQIGYVILRYEFNAKKKQFISKSFIRGVTGSGDLQESLVATSDDSFKPVSYHYTTKLNKTVKMIDAKFKKSKKGFTMTAAISDGKASKTVTRPIPAGAFLSSFQVLMMLQNGLTVGKKYSFKAIAEEDAQVYSGEALIKKQKGFEKKGILRVLNKFKNTQYISNLTTTGEVLITESPVQKIQTQLVASPAEATKGFPYEVSSLKLIFGEVPRGQNNILARRKNAPVKVEKAAKAKEIAK